MLRTQKLLACKLPLRLYILTDIKEVNSITDWLTCWLHSVWDTGTYPLPTTHYPLPTTHLLPLEMLTFFKERINTQGLLGFVQSFWNPELKTTLIFHVPPGAHHRRICHPCMVGVFCLWECTFWHPCSQRCRSEFPGNHMPWPWPWEFGLHDIRFGGQGRDLPHVGVTSQVQEDFRSRDRQVQTFRARDSGHHHCWHR